jgi:hypothetical protein
MCVSDFELALTNSLQSLSIRLAERFSNCGADFVVIECSNCGTRHTLSVNCGLRICQGCTAKRYTKLYSKYRNLLQSKHPGKLSLLTLTIKNVATLDRNIVKTLIQSFLKFRRRTYVKKRLIGGLWCMEVKGTAGNYNLHIHAVIEHIYFGRPSRREASQISIPERLAETKGISSRQDLLNYSEKDIGQIILSAIWQDITTDPVIDIRRVRSHKDALRYVLKYVTKPPDLEAPKDFVEFLMAFSCIPMLKTFGSWYNAIEFPKLFIMCMNCNSIMSWRIVDASWFPHWRIHQDIESIRGRDP